MKIKKTVITMILLFSLAFPAHAHAGWGDFVDWCDDVVDTTTDAVDAVVDTTTDVVDYIVDGGEAIVEVGVEVSEDIITGVIEFFIDGGEWMYDASTTFVEGTLNFFFGLADGVVTLLSYFGLDVDISHWFSSGVYNSEDTAELWSVARYAEVSEDADYLQNT